MPDIIANIGRKHALSAIFTCGSAILIPSSLDARERQQPRPEIFTKLLACRDVADAKTRLACYDSQVSAMASASDNDEVVVLDKEELNKTRRSLFGFAFPRLPFLGGGDDGDDEHRLVRVSRGYQNPGRAGRQRNGGGDQSRVVQPLPSRISRVGQSQQMPWAPDLYRLR